MHESGSQYFTTGVALIDNTFGSKIDNSSIDNIYCNYYIAMVHAQRRRKVPFTGFDNTKTESKQIKLALLHTQMIHKSSAQSMLFL